MCKSTINFLHKIFARLGVLGKILSDNGSQFIAKEFGDICKEFSISHVTTTLFHPRSNGHAECFLDMFKQAIRKPDGGETEDELLQQFLRFYQITSGISPAYVCKENKIGI